MKLLTTILILILASTNASRYFRPDQRFQQDPLSKAKYQEMMALALNDDRFLPRYKPTEEMAKWESPPEPKMIFLNDLESLENYLQDESNDYRMKRTKTSLSIDNPLDVLRQQYYRALARRMKFKSIEKNREHLLKTGKRSFSESEEQPEINQQSQNGGKPDFEEGNQNEGRRFQNPSDDSSFQT